MGDYWTAQPTNWEELAYTLNNEDVFLSFNPNDPPKVDQEILNMF